MRINFKNYNTEVAFVFAFGIAIGLVLGCLFTLRVKHTTKEKKVPYIQSYERLNKDCSLYLGGSVEVRAKRVEMLNKIIEK